MEAAERSTLLPPPKTELPIRASPITPARSLSPASRVQALEGLRGVLCLVVVLHHLLCGFAPCVIFGPSMEWVDDPGACSDGSGWVAFAAPLYNGKFAVVAFFTLSGFALSFHPLAALEDGGSGALAHRVTKRYFRLGVPSAAGLVFAYASGLIEPHHAVGRLTGSRWLQRFGPRLPSVSGLVAESLWGWAAGSSSFHNGIHSMSYELVGSLLVFGLCALRPGLGRLGHGRVCIAVALFCLAPRPHVVSSLAPAAPLVVWSSPSGGEHRAIVPLHLLAGARASNVTFSSRRGDWLGGARRGPGLPSEGSSAVLPAEPAASPLLVTSPLADGPGLVESLQRAPRLRVWVEDQPARSEKWAAPHAMYASFVAGHLLAAAHQPGEGRVWPAGGARCLATSALAVVAWACAAFPFQHAPHLVQRSILFRGMSELASAAHWGDAEDVVFYTLGSALLVHGVLLSTRAQRLLTSTPCLWLGRISFSLYLTHIPLIYSFTCGAFACLSSYRAPLFSYRDTALVACTVSAPVMIAVAYCFYVAVERSSPAQSVRIAAAIVS
mmetsp:Transcript_21610/g.71485  ORF Transcript_21610/g.71485 Transcript_21610/m.71485 type:complete len:553 (+) Transcript_21610:19-1677(+)